MRASWVPPTRCSRPQTATLYPSVNKPVQRQPDRHCCDNTGPLNFTLLPAEANNGTPLSAMFDFPARVQNMLLFSEPGSAAAPGGYRYTPLSFCASVFCSVNESEQWPLLRNPYEKQLCADWREEEYGHMRSAILPSPGFSGSFSWRSVLRSARSDVQNYSYVLRYTVEAWCVFFLLIYTHLAATQTPSCKKMGSGG